MVIRLSSFGTLLVSRPAGREAYLAALAYSLPDTTSESIEIDFTGIKVLTPSWLDEFFTPLKKKYGEKIIIGPTDNPSVRASMAIITRQ